MNINSFLRVGIEPATDALVSPLWRRSHIKIYNRLYTKKPQLQQAIIYRLINIDWYHSNVKPKNVTN